MRKFKIDFSLPVTLLIASMIGASAPARAIEPNPCEEGELCLNEPQFMSELAALPNGEAAAKLALEEVKGARASLRNFILSVTNLPAASDAWDPKWLEQIKQCEIVPDGWPASFEILRCLNGLQGFVLPGEDASSLNPKSEIVATYQYIRKSLMHFHYRMIRASVADGAARHNGVVSQQLIKDWDATSESAMKQINTVRMAYGHTKIVDRSTLPDEIPNASKEYEKNKDYRHPHPSAPKIKRPVQKPKPQPESPAAKPEAPKPKVPKVEPTKAEPPKSTPPTTPTTPTTQPTGTPAPKTPGCKPGTPGCSKTGVNDGGSADGEKGGEKGGQKGGLKGGSLFDGIEGAVVAGAKPSAGTDPKGDPLACDPDSIKKYRAETRQWIGPERAAHLPEIVLAKQKVFFCLRSTQPAFADDSKVIFLSRLGFRVAKVLAAVRGAMDADGVVPKDSPAHAAIQAEFENLAKDIAVLKTVDDSKELLALEESLLRLAKSDANDLMEFAKGEDGRKQAVASALCAWQENVVEKANPGATEGFSFDLIDSCESGIEARKL